MTAGRRLRDGWTAEQAFGLVPHQRRGHGTAISVGGRRYRTLAEAGYALGIDPRTLRARIARGRSSEEALGLIPRQRAPRRTCVTCRGHEYRSIAALSRAFGLGEPLVAKRLRAGWTPEQSVGVEEPPPRFRNEAGRPRPRHWKQSVRLGTSIYPAAGPGGYRLYVLRNDVNGREYVGVTISPLPLRLSNHRANARRGLPGKLYNAMRHHGVDHFSIHLVRNDARDFRELQAQEIAEIARRNTRRSGYNTTAGGEVGRVKAITVAGQRFGSRAAAAEHFGVDPTVFNLRVGRLGWSPEEAAGLRRRKFGRRPVSAAGVTYPSLRAASAALGVPYKRAHDRVVNKGWSESQALELDPPPDSVKYLGQETVAFGRSFRSLNACARHFGLKPETLRARIHRGDAIDNAIADLCRTLRLPDPRSARLRH